MGNVFGPFFFVESNHRHNYIGYGILEMDGRVGSTWVLSKIIFTLPLTNSL
jgi:hypothetical protein